MLKTKKGCQQEVNISYSKQVEYQMIGIEESEKNPKLSIIPLTTNWIKN
jgi:hypothetical protein